MMFCVIVIRKDKTLKVIGPLDNEKVAIAYVEFIEFFNKTSECVTVDLSGTNEVSSSFGYWLT